KDIINAKTKPAINEGLIKGNVILKKAPIGVEPSPSAAKGKFLSNPLKLAYTEVKTKGTAKIVCPRITPVYVLVKLKSENLKNNAIATSIPGIAIGAIVKLIKSPFPGKLIESAATAAITPRNVANKAVDIAIIKLFLVTDSHSSLSSKTSYHFKENP